MARNTKKIEKLDINTVGNVENVGTGVWQEN
jgi:hypothetical protein